MAKRSKKAPKQPLQAAPVNVIFGKDRRRAVDNLHKLIDLALHDADPQLALSQYEGDSVELADVLDELKTLPFLSECRVVVVKDADPFISNYRGELEAYCENPSSTGVLILMVESFPGNTRLYKTVAKMGTLVDCSPVKPNDLGRYIREYADNEHGLSISADAIEMLIELAGDDTGMLMSEIDKLASYIGDDEKNRTIQADHITALVGHNRRFDVFNVIDAMVAGHTAEALNLLDRMLSQDKDAEYKSVGAFAWHFRRIYNACVMLKKRTPESQIFKQLRIWPREAQPQFIQQARRIGGQGASKALIKLMDIDLASKTGRGTVKVGLEKFIVELASRETHKSI